MTNDTKYTSAVFLKNFYDAILCNGWLKACLNELFIIHSIVIFIRFVVHNYITTRAPGYQSNH